MFLQSTEICDNVVKVLTNLVEHISVGDVAIVDLYDSRQQLKEVIVALPFLLHEQICVVALHSLPQLLADPTVFLHNVVTTTNCAGIKTTQVLS